MTVEARVTKIWKNQKLILVLLLLGFSAAFLFDGFIRYPRKNEQIRKYKELDGEKNKSAWEEFCRTKGWSPEVDAEHLAKGYNVLEQFVFAGITGCLGLIAFTFWFTQKDRVLRMDDTGISTRAGEHIPFDAITRIDAKKWKSKGIASIKYQHGGRAGAFIVDDYKFETTAARQIYDEIEKRLKAKA